jgi:murein DD-endopeptidase MepM/ murein hydrolase activator NlpD
MRIKLRNSRPGPRLVLIAAGAAAIAVSGCSRDTTRYNEDPLGNPFETRSNDVTYSATQRASGIESQPLSSPQQYPQQPNYSSAPRAVPAAPAPTYHPQNASYGPSATGTVSSSPGQGQWRWDGGTAITVQQGETLDTIARRFGVPPQAIQQANNIAAPGRVYPGQRLVIPTYQVGGAYQPAQKNLQPAAAPAYTPAPSYNPAPAQSAATNGAGRIHVVNPGDTLYALGRRYGVSHVTIAHANGIHQESLLRVGQRLTVPGYGTSRTASADPRPQAPAPRAAAPAPAPAADTNRFAAVPAQQPQEQSAAKVTPVEEEPEATRSLGTSPQFRWPVRGRIISGFGPKANGQHNDGINLSVPEGTEVKAAEGGVVAYAGNELKGYGNLVLIRHSDGWMTAYAHNSELMVKRGDNVQRGQTVARAGQTGGVASPQLHFEIRRGSTPVDPTQYLASL